MKITYEMVEEHRRKNRRYSPPSIIAPFGFSLYIFHKTELFEEMMQDSKHFYSHGPFYLLAPGILETYERRDAKEWLEEMLE